MARVLGHSDPRTLDAAEQLGLSLQRVRIVKDIGGDARHGRIYICLLYTSDAADE